MKRAGYLLVILALVPSIGGCYLLKQGTYLLRYNGRSRSIDKVLARGSVSGDVEAMLRCVQEIRRYAVEEIGLEKNRNYTRYVELDRDYVVDVVTACEADSFTPHQWRFPIFGSFPYKGFYEKSDADREADRLGKKGLDVWTRKVDGFSTLGFFSDPIYSFMSDYSLYALADLIIHEQTHATIFIKNQIQFNEELATFVGREGALGFLRTRYGIESEAYTQALAGLRDWNVFRDEVIGLYHQLDRIYGLGLDRETILAEKQRIVGEFNRRLISQAQELFRTDRYRSFQGIPVNNAYIMSFVRYSRDLELFYRLYESRGRDLRATVEALKQLERRRGSPKTALRLLINE
ncbi:MAG: aminopeptidase [Spirochaetales bacterium]|nr:aminopeptidase [Spirochaetales bacterium]